ncbi:hypothetical protein TcCL_NonESM10901 [Trypanosoma cruzi]|nr:hypothetical protein TcCL_NonESM10901 [Trypanosoma cruzi]
MAANTNKAKHDHHNYSYFIHRTTVDAHMSPWLSAGTHSPHTPLQTTAVYASADTASSSGAHTHAELLRLPSISRRRDGARVVVVVGASVVVVLGATGAVVVVVVVVGARVVVVVVVVGACVVFVVVSGVFNTTELPCVFRRVGSSHPDPSSTPVSPSGFATISVSESCSSSD